MVKAVERVCYELNA